MMALVKAVQNDNNEGRLDVIEDLTENKSVWIGVEAVQVTKNLQAPLQYKMPLKMSDKI